MKRISINKNEAVAEVVETIIAEPDSDIILIVPKDAALGESVINFRLIKREADAIGKRIIVESVDEEILASAKASRLESIHPLFKRKKRSSALSDIVPVEDEKDEEGETPFRRWPKQRKLTALADTFHETEEDKKGQAKEAVKAPKKSRPRRWLSRPRLVLFIGVPLVVLVAGLWFASVFRRAEVIINFEEIPWEYQNNFVASAGATSINPKTRLLPAELFTQEKNLTKLFPASGRDYVSEKATGKILIFNAYSSEPQALVATTRFFAPDGKLFRLDSSVLVPGAEIKDGKIIPASTEAKITADKPGAEYNLENVERLSIPGFKGSPKYDGFYGSIIKTSGGFIGERAVPTEDDIAAAKKETENILKSNLESSFLGSQPVDFDIPEGASQIQTIRLSINSNTDQDGNFGVFGEAVLRAVGFRRSDLKTLLISLASEDYPLKTFKEFSPSYSEVIADFNKRNLTFSLSVQSTLTQNFSSDEFKNQILGLGVARVRALILDLPGLKDAKISVWPSWLKKLPKNKDRIKIIVD